MKVKVIIVIFLLLPNWCFSQASVNPNISPRKFTFIENKGHIIDQNNKPNPKILYLLNTPGMNVQLRRGGFSYDLYRISNVEQRISNIEVSCDRSHGWGYDSSTVSFHRIDFDLIGSNPACEIISSGPSADYLNYYTTGTPVEGVTTVRSYQTGTYKNTYPGIDLEFMTDDQHGVKYNFVMHPDGDLALVIIKISGVEPEVISIRTPYDENLVGKHRGNDPGKPYHPGEWI